MTGHLASNPAVGSYAVSAALKQGQVLWVLAAAGLRLKRTVL
jgi:hypothetical protein